jgi:nanoRNase/pAp phosphatase (c-di-AMP/oligoRNAs hydrolase)
MHYERLERLRSVAQKNGKPWGIIITQVDPDALGAAFGLREILKSFEVRDENITIFYSGNINHPQNGILINRFGLIERKFQQVSRSFNPEDFQIALVDSSQDIDPRFCAKILSPKIVIDHHRGSTVKEGEDSFFYLDEVGAASTLVSELLFALKINLAEIEPFIYILLAVGIHTDTQNLVNAKKRDITAYAHLMEHVDTKELSACFQYPLPASYFENRRRALERAVINNACLMSNIGVLNGNADDIAIIADEFIRHDGVSLVIIWTIIGKVVRISARNTDSSRDLGQFLRERFGPSCGAKMTEVGHGIGGGIIEIDLGPLFIPEAEKEIEALVNRFLSIKLGFK